MYSSNPVHKPIFQTPPRDSTQHEVYSSYRKTTPPTAQPKQYSQQTPHFETNIKHPEQKPTKHINIRISEKTNKPYLTNPSNYPAYQSTSHRIIQKYTNLPPNQLLQVITLYQYQIAILKDYIHQSDLVQRQRIVDIFGFDYACCNPLITQQSKQVLKQLSTKIQHLIRENNNLKQQNKSNKKIAPFESIIYTKQDQLLLKQNQKLRMLLNQLKNSQSREIIILEQDINRLKKDNESLNQLVRKYKNKIQVMEDVRKSKTTISEIKNIRQSTLPPTAVKSSPEQLQFMKKQLTIQLFEFSQQLENKNKENEQKIQDLARKVQWLQKNLQEYEKQRKFKIDSTIRKSFVLSQRMPQLKGDADNETFILPIDQKPFKKQQGKIRTTYRFSRPQQQFQRIKNMQQSIPESNKAQLKQLQDSLSMQKLKNKNITQQNNMLKRQLDYIQQQKGQKIQRIIQLQKIVSQLQKDKSHQNKSNPQFEKQLHDIIQVLKSCNIHNYDLFFKEFNQILAQRKILRDTIQGYKNANQVVSKSKQSQSSPSNKQLKTALEQKVDELIAENRKLLKKISELESQIQQYHQQIIMSQIQKLNTIKFNEPIQPNGESALQWQVVVKNSIEGALVRLYNLQRKIKQNQKIVKSSGAQRVGESNPMEYSQVRRLGSKG